MYAVATSAIRDARNGERFLKAARAASGLNIEVISDEEEARFGYVAAVNSSTMTDGFVLETGGGSIQLIEVANRRSESLRSFPLGAVRVTEEFLPGSGPAKKKDLQRVRAHVRETTGLPMTVAYARTRTLAKLFADAAKPDGCIAVTDPDHETELLAKLPVTEIAGIAKRSAAKTAIPSSI